MTEISFYFSNKAVTGVTTCGHCGYSKKGTDIVCAAVSSLIQTLEIGLSTVAQISSLDMSYNLDNITRTAKWSPSDYEKVSLLVDSIRLALKAIEAKYPKNLKIKDVFV